MHGSLHVFLTNHLKFWRKEKSHREPTSLKTVLRLHCKLRVVVVFRGRGVAVAPPWLGLGCVFGCPWLEIGIP